MEKQHQAKLTLDAELSPVTVVVMASETNTLKDLSSHIKEDDKKFDERLLESPHHSQFQSSFQNQKYNDLEFTSHNITFIITTVIKKLSLKNSRKSVVYRRSILKS